MMVSFKRYVMSVKTVKTRDEAPKTDLVEQKLELLDLVLLDD